MSERQYMNENVQQKARKPDANTPDAAPEVNDLVKLQGVVGNQGVQRLLAQRKLIIQPKLNVTAAGDKYEQEADSVAQQVVKQINQPQTAQGAGMQRAGEEDELQMKRIQRAGEEDELQMQRIQRAGEEDELQMQRIQRESFEQGGDVGGDIESSIESARGSGQTIDGGVRGKLEGAFGADFSG